VTVFVNDEPRNVDFGLSLRSFLLQIDMVDLSGWAIALNEVVVSEGEIGGKNLSDGDRLILIQATQGG
jgi:thiamine biosynthesis protein ThiS